MQRNSRSLTLSSRSIFIAFVLEAFLLELDLAEHPAADNFRIAVQSYLTNQCVEGGGVI